jgi:hypothetical protein
MNAALGLRADFFAIFEFVWSEFSLGNKALLEGKTRVCIGKSADFQRRNADFSLVKPT